MPPLAAGGVWLKSKALLKPFVYGLVHMEVLAEPIAAVATKESGFFFGALLKDPARLLEGTGKRGRGANPRGGGSPRTGRATCGCV
jgi:hypothetical protein